MTLLEKLHSVYALVSHVEKSGHNKVQNYDYVKSADVTREIRKALTEVRAYAEINFHFVGEPYTIARAKEPNAPFSAVNVRCSITFHDLDNPTFTLTSSGLGTGCDTSDKAAYKAQTGALKYALKNAFLVPDEADPEADESTDEKDTREPGDEPIHDSRPTRGATAAAASRATASTGETTAQASFEGDGALPTEAEMEAFRLSFGKLGEELATDGKLKASKSLPVNRKLLVFLLHITKADDAKSITRAQWENFFQRVDAKKADETGLIGLAALINQVNGVEPKDK
jgi:hypothetical protein